jgi:hypothetical protein
LPIYSHWNKPEDLNPIRLKAISHFFEHYKGSENSKWGKKQGWEGTETAHKEIMDGIADYNKFQAQFQTQFQARKPDLLLFAFVGASSFAFDGCLGVLPLTDRLDKGKNKPNPTTSVGVFLSG